jgi:hypothetical protein
MKLLMKKQSQKNGNFFPKNKIQHKDKLVRSFTFNRICQFYLFMLRGCENSPRKKTLILVEWSPIFQIKNIIFSKLRNLALVLPTTQKG